MLLVLFKVEARSGSRISLLRSSVGIVTRLRAEQLRNHSSISGRKERLLHCVHIDFGTHPVSCEVDAQDCLALTLLDTVVRTPTELRWPPTHFCSSGQNVTNDYKICASYPKRQHVLANSNEHGHAWIRLPAQPQTTASRKA